MYLRHSTILYEVRSIDKHGLLLILLHNYMEFNSFTQFPYSSSVT